MISEQIALEKAQQFIDEIGENDQIDIAGVELSADRKYWSAYRYSKGWQGDMSLAAVFDSRNLLVDARTGEAQYWHVSNSPFIASE